MTLSQISPEQKAKTLEKFELWDKVLEKELLQTNPEYYWGFLKTDPTIFAYHFFKDDSGDRLRLFPWQDVFVNDNSRLKIAINARQVGKTTLEAVDLLHQAYFFQTQVLVCISSTKEQVKELITKINTLMTGSGFTYWKVLTPRQMDSSRSVHVKNRGTKAYSRILSVPATDAARGYSANKVVLDELAFMENSSYILNRVAIPSTIKTGGPIVGLTTPNGQAGPTWEIYSKPSSWSVYNFNWQANPLITPEAIERVKSSPGTTIDAFSAEYEAKFLAAENAFFNQKLISASISDEAGKESFPTGNLAVGVDFGKHRDYSVIMIGKVHDSEENKPSVTVCDRRVKPLGTNYSEVMNELKDINNALSPAVFVLDATGLGDVPFELLSDAGLPCEPIVLTQNRKLEILNHLKILFEQGRIKIPDEKSLIDQLCLYSYKYTKQMENLPSEPTKKVGAPEGTHDDEVIALALMAWGLTGVYAPASVSVIEREPARIGRQPRSSGKELIYCPSCENYHWDNCPQGKSDYS